LRSLVRKDTDTLMYIFRHGKKYIDSLKDRNQIQRYIMMIDTALEAGNLDLGKWLIDQYSSDILFMFDQSVIRIIIQCSLRLNHLPYLQSLLSDDKWKSYLKNLTMRYIFLSNDKCRHLPKVNLETYEFCISIYGKQTKEDIDVYKASNKFDNEIFE
jgi:hypothetical protein